MVVTRFAPSPTGYLVEPVIRIKAPTSGEIVVHDGVKGDVVFQAEDILDDFVIARADGSPTYNFVVAVDDALMGINEVIRGDDHLSNTPKQIVVYKALGFDIPKFYHVPMIHNQQGKKLSKRDGATDVMAYKEMGYLPEALLNFLVRLGWSHGDQEIFSMDEMKRKTLKELANLINEIIITPSAYDEKAVKKAFKGNAIEVLETFANRLAEAQELHLPSDYHHIMEKVVEEMEIGFGCKTSALLQTFFLSPSAL